jgi:uncharacterized hydrophobic protein (TIGR00341 family)
VRLLHVSVPRGKRDAVVSLLEDEGVDYVLNEETGRRAFTHVVTFPLPTAAVQPVLEQLGEIGVKESFTIVTEAASVSTEGFKSLSERYEESEAEDRISREELSAKANSLASPLPTYLALTVVSAVIATAGLLLDSPATVVGSMVIAPLIGPAMAAAVGTVVDDRNLFSRGVRLQVIGMVTAVIAAAVFGFTVQLLNLIPPGLDPMNIEQVRERLKPDFLSLAVALGAGTAGAVSLTTGISSAIVGVMIAVALIPPAATVGIGLAFGLPSVALPAGVLAIVNGLSVNLAALLVLWYAGYRPEYFFRHEEARAAMLKRVAVLLSLIALLSLFLGGVTLDSFQNAQVEDEIRGEVESLFADGEGEYSQFSLLSMAVETEPRPNTLILQRVDHIVVTVGTPPGEETDGLAGDLGEQVQATVGQDVTVEVRYVTVESIPALRPGVMRPATAVEGSGRAAQPCLHVSSYC